jgi:hypothetical protein
MKKFFILLGLIVLLSGSILATDVSKVGDWWGKVTINGVENNNGAVVDAYINSVKVSSATVGQYASKYYLIHIEGEAGDPILFRINGRDATTVAWSNGDHELNLAVNYSTTSNNGGSPSGGGGNPIVSFVEGLFNSGNDETQASDSGNEGQINLDQNPEETTSSTNFLTAAVIGLTDFSKSPAGIIIFVVLITLAGAIISITTKRKNKNPKIKKK